MVSSLSQKGQTACYFAIFSPPTQTKTALCVIALHYLDGRCGVGNPSNPSDFVVRIDRGLNWNKQIKVVTQKYNSKLCQLKRMGRFLQAKNLEEIYFKSIIPCVVYCIVVWGTVSTAKFGEIEAIHRRAAKFIHKLTGSEDPLEQANWKPLEYIYKRRVVTIMHEVYHEDNSKIVKSLRKKLQVELLGVTILLKSQDQNVS